MMVEPSSDRGVLKGAPWLEAFDRFEAGQGLSHVSLAVWLYEMTMQTYHRAPPPLPHQGQGRSQSGRCLLPPYLSRMV